MKKQAAFLTGFFLFTLLPFCSFAQSYTPGSIITLEGKTITGFIKKQSTQAHCLEVKFKKNKTDKTVTYRPESLKSYQFEDNVYQSSKLQLKGGDLKQAIFLKQIVQGKIELFRLDYEVKQEQSAFYQYESVFYIIRSEDQTIIVNQEFYLQELEKLEKKCPTPISESNGGKRFTDESMANTIVVLNNCQGETSKIIIDVNKPEKKRLLKYGVSMGLHQTDMFIGHPAFEDFNYEQLSQPMIGAFIDLPIVKESLSIRSGFYYLKYQAKGMGTATAPENYANAGEVIQLEGLANLNYITVPLDVKYEFSNFKLKPYGFAGIQFGVRIHNTASVERRKFIPPGNGMEKPILSKEQIEPYDAAIANYNLAWKSGIGIAFSLSSKLDIFGELYYGKFKNEVKKENNRSFLGTSIGGNIGLRF